MRTLRQDGWLKVCTGRTSIEEVVKATKGDTVVMPQAAKKAVAG